MSVARSVAEVLRDHVVLEVEAIDRMYLNVYVPHLQSVGAVVGYLRVHRGQRFASTTAVTPMTEAFVRNIDQFVNDEGVDLVAFKKGQRKDDVHRSTRGSLPSVKGYSMSARPRRRRGSCARSGAAVGSQAEPIRGSWNPPRWSTTTISIASMKTSGRSS
jgi:hypothetical protein